jgi:hypothetical protein
MSVPQELISGILWLVREGENYVEESLREEYLDFQVLSIAADGTHKVTWCCIQKLRKDNR